MRSEWFLSLFALALTACGSDDTSGGISKFGSVALFADSVPATDDAPATMTRSGDGFFFALQSGDATCEVTLSTDDCRVWTCSDAAYLPAQSSPLLSAGAVQITAGSDVMTFNATDSGEYELPETEANPAWQGGAPLELTVEGSTDFPAFDLKMSAPELLDVTAPQRDISTIDVNADLALAWTPLVTTSVHATVSTETPDDQGGSIIVRAADCEYAGYSGAGTIPAEVLAALPKPPGLSNYVFDLFTVAYGFQLNAAAETDFYAVSRGLTAQVAVE